MYVSLSNTSVFYSFSLPPACRRCYASARPKCLQRFVSFSFPHYQSTISILSLSKGPVKFQWPSKRSVQGSPKWCFPMAHTIPLPRMPAVSCQAYFCLYPDHKPVRCSESYPARWRNVVPRITISAACATTSRGSTA